MAGVVSKQFRCLSVSNLMGEETFWNNCRCKLRQLLDILNLAGKICNIRHACTLKEISKTREGVHTGDDNETALRKWEPMELKSKF